MKKVLFLLAVAGMFTFAACNNNTEATEETTDSVCATAVEEVVAEETIDTTAVAVEEVATEAAAEEVVAE